MSRTGDPYPLVRSPWGRTTTAPDLSPAEAEIVAAFESAPTPPEVREAAVLEEVARALRDLVPELGARALTWERSLNVARRLVGDPRVAAAVAAYRATQDGGAEERWATAEEVASRYFDRGDDEWDQLRTDVAESLAGNLRAALATQAGDGAR